MRFRATLSEEGQDVVLVLEETLLGGEIQLAGDVYAAFYRAGYRTAVSIHFEHPFYLLAVVLIRDKMEGLLYTLDD